MRACGSTARSLRSEAAKPRTNAALTVDTLFAGPLWVDLVIGFTLVEGLALTLYHRVTGRGIAPAQFGANMISGVFLMLALRSALAFAGWRWVALWVLAAGLTHGLDMWRRWQRFSA